jgi:hypothetical protein
MSQQATEVVEQKQLTTEQYYQMALKIQRALLTRFSELFCYGWDNSYKWKQLNETKDYIIENIGKINFTNFSSEQLLSLGFGIFSKKDNLHLIPLYFYPFLESEQYIECIDGTSIIVCDGYQLAGSEENKNYGYIDNDHRFGLIAYGFKPTS